MYEITSVTDDIVRDRPGQTYDVVMGATIKQSGQDDIKVRIKVHRDSYDFQSWARAEVWSRTDLRWNEAVSDLPAEVARQTSGPYNRVRDSVRAVAHSYAEDLLRRTEQLLNWLS